MDQDDDTPRPIPAGWLEAMDESDADLAARRVVPFSVVQAELRASIARLEARLLDADRPETEPEHSTASRRP